MDPDTVEMIYSRTVEELSDIFDHVPMIPIHIGDETMVADDGSYIEISKQVIREANPRTTDGVLLLRATIIHELFHILFRTDINNHREKTLNQLFQSDFSNHLSLITWYTYHESEGWLDRKAYSYFSDELSIKNQRNLIHTDFSDIEQRLQNAACLSVLNLPFHDSICERIADDWRLNKISGDHLSLLLSDIGEDLNSKSE